MIFNMQGVPLNIVLVDLGLHLFERKANPPPKRPRAQKYTGAILRAIRAARGVGRPIKSEVFAGRVDEEANIPLAHTLPLLERIQGCLATGYTQRAAAEHIGISLGKLQCELRKAA